MCNGFGMIVRNDLRAYFTTPDKDGNISHSDILAALKWKENTDQFNRRFIRVECPDWTMGSFRFDEAGTLPGWAEEKADEIRAMVERELEKAAPALAEYKRVRDTAWAEYQRVRGTAEAEYQRVRGTAWAQMVSCLRKIGSFVE